jgi:hypothetical protein
LKRLVSISLIFILAAQSLFQLGLFTYFEINRDYIAQVLCINRNNYNPEEPQITMCGGQCFLKKNLKLAENSPTDEKVPSSRLKIEIPSFVLSDYVFSLDIAIPTRGSHSTPYLLAEVRAVLPSIFHPPSL